jgi:vacuolar-type H+-ATPase subunit C/Vma6
MKTVRLDKSSFESAKVSVKLGELFTPSQLSMLKEKSFEDCLTFLEEHGFRSEVDSSYLSYEGFYLVEVILNKHLSKLYSDIIGSSSKKNKDFFELYYLKYQIHNVMALVRCKKSGEKELSAFLIGDSRRKEKYLKAFSMPIEDALTYLSKKLGFDSQQVLSFYEKGIFSLENYLYKEYFTRLISSTISFNGRDEYLFLNYIRSYIDIVNLRVFAKLQLEKDLPVTFKDFFIKGGTLSFSDFDSVSELELSESLSKLSKKIGRSITSPLEIDSLLSTLKKETLQSFEKVRFGSPFYVLKYFLRLEKEISYLRTVLKAKYLKLSDEQLAELF